MFESYYTAAVILVMTISLVKDIFKPSIILFFSLILMYLGNIISLDETFAGFSNHGMLTVGVLFIVASALQSSTVFGSLIEKILGNGKSKLGVGGKRVPGINYIVHPNPP